MNDLFRFSALRWLTTAAFAVSAFSVHAQQTVNVNGSACPGATVQFGQNVINISTAGCGGSSAVAPTITTATPPQGTTGSPYSYQFGASGAPTPTWTIASGTVAGLSLSSSGLLSGTPTAVGSTMLTVQAQNSAGTASQQVTVNIVAPSGPPTITSATPPTTIAQNATYPGHTFTATGAQPMTWTVTSGTLPTGLTLSSAGVLSATQITSAPGMYPVTVTASNGVNPAATQSFTITVNPAVATPTITSISPNNGTAGSSTTISGTNYVVGSTSVTIGGVAASITNQTATTLTVTVPASLTAATHSVVVTVTGAAATATSTYTVNAVTSGGFEATLDSGTLTGITKSPFMFPPVRPGKLNGAGPDMNAYAMEITSCATSNGQLTSTSAAVTRRWQHNIDFSSYLQNTPVEYVSMGAGEAFTYMFTPQSGYRFIQFNEATLARFVPTFMSISTTPCDFDPTKLVSGSGRDWCYNSSPTANLVYYQVTTGAATAPFCKLVPGQKYYLNLRFLDARPVGGNLSVDTCSTSGQSLCGGVLQIQ